MTSVFILRLPSLINVEGLFLAQNFDDWDDVGLNIPKPPNLLELFRGCSTVVLSDKERLDRIKDLVREGEGKLEGFHL